VYNHLAKLFALACGWLAFSCSSAEPESSEQPTPHLPNIIYIMADDLGYQELGSYGQELIKTPYLDQLAEQGMRFTDFYAGSTVCAPSRCTLLTGKHTGHSYVRDNYELGDFSDENEGGQLPLPEGTFTLAGMLKEKGYHTGAIGKWGLGGPGSTGIPNQQGFDYFYGYLCQKQAHNYYPTHLWENEEWDTLDNTYFHPHQQFDGNHEKPDDYQKYKGQEYSQDLMAGKALEFIDQHHDQPFFLYLPFPVPHLALQVPVASLQQYVGTFPEAPYLGQSN
jgi:arylsulfatase A-like enzyme